MRNLNEPEVENSAHAMVANMIRTPEGRERLCAAVVHPIMHQVKFRSPWLGFMFRHEPVPNPGHTATGSTRTLFSALRPDLVDRAQGFVVSNLLQRIEPEVQGWMPPAVAMTLTQENWDEARAGYRWVVVSPEVFNRLLAEPWWCRMWSPTTRMELTRVGHFGVYGSVDEAEPLIVLASKTYYPTAMLFGRGTIGSMEMAVTVAPGSASTPEKVSWDVEMTVKVLLDATPIDNATCSARELTGSVL